MASGWRSGSVILYLGAWAENMAFDAFSRVVPALAPPHLLTAYMPEAIREMVSPGILAPVTSAVLAAIALLCLHLVPPATPRRTMRLAAWILGFWFLSEGLMAWVWLDAPASVLLPSLAFGVVRSLVVAALLVRQQGPTAESR
jgi:hypothetical protein